MAQAVSPLPGLSPPAVCAPLPEVRLERQPAGSRPAAYALTEIDFLIGSVPGCDLRVSGADRPAVLCLIARQPGGVTLRKLSPIQSVLVNGQAVTHALLADADRIAVGSMELRVHINLPALAEDAPKPQPRQDLDQLAAQLEERQQRLEKQTTDLENDRVLWYQRRDEMERECRQLREAAAAAMPQVQAAGDPRELAQRAEALDRRQAEVDAQAADLGRQKQELATVRQELADIRTQLYERYRERRDRLAGLQEAVERAARKVQESKRRFEAELPQTEARRRELDQQQTALEARAAELVHLEQQVDEQRRRVDAQLKEHQQELAGRLTELQEREDKLAADRQALEASQAQHQADLLRLDRSQAAQDQRDKQLQARAQEIERRLATLQQDSSDMEESVAQLDEWQAKLSAEAERLNQQKAEQDAAGAELARRAAALEGQQATVAALRTRLERMRLEVRREEQQLTEQRSGQTELEASLNQQREEVQRQRDELEAERSARERERQELIERSAVVEAAVAQLRQAQEKLATQEETLRQRAAELDAKVAEHAEQAALVQARAAQLEEAHRLVEAERQALRQRTQDLAQAEQAREVLQEQLRRRSEELIARQKTLAEQVQEVQQQTAALEERRAELLTERQNLEEQITARQQELDARAAALQQQQSEIASREAAWQQHTERVQDAGRAVAAERKALAAERTAVAGHKLEAAEAVARARAECEAARRDAVELQQQLPELELRAGTALERVTHARDQLREHLREVHAYARQCQDDLESLRGQVQAEGERVQQQELALRRSQDEHRLAVVAFRQQLIDWQGQIADLKRLLAQDETRLARQQAKVEEQARQVDATSQRLAQQAEELEQQERIVTERRAEMDRHLADMRDWYRRKLRELAGIDADRLVSHETRAGASAEPILDRDAAAARPSILSLTGDVDPADRRLGDLLGSLGLIETEALSALLVEARRQRRSLRQILLASGAVTLYQMALMEAGNLDALMLGPVRVVDRLRVTPRETVYRVFDPRRGQEAVLRHLAEAEMEDALHPDEFRQRFTQAIVTHPNVAGTLEVLEVHGRPAALQEWLTGLPSTDWPALAAAPGVCFRLLNQAALGLHTAHQLGMLHGHLHAELLLLTAEGVLKVCGFGEPAWLVTPPVADGAENAGADLQALGKIVAGWIGPGGRRKASKGKGMPELFHAVLDRLCGLTSGGGYPSAAVLLQELDQAGAAVPPNAEAWDRLLRHVRENALPEVALRQSA